MKRAVFFFAATILVGILPTAQATEAMRADAAGNVGVGTSSPAQKLHVVGDTKLEGGVFEKVTIVNSTSYTAGSEAVIIADPGTVGGDITINLPYAGNAQGQLLTIKKTTDPYSVFVTATSGFEKGTSIVLTTAGSDVYPYLTAVSDGSRWFVVSSAGAQKMADLSDGLKAYLNMNESSGTTASDSSGTGNNGSLVGGLSFSGSGYLDFDGADDNVNLGNASSLSLTTMTLSAWVNSHSYSLEDYQMRAIFSKRNGSPMSFELEVTNITNELYLEWYNGTYYSVSDSSGAMPLNTWVHVALTIDSSNHYVFYRNGVAGGSGTLSTSIATNSDSVRIGAMWSGGVYGNWDGYMDGVRIYNRALTASDIQALYNLGR